MASAYTKRLVGPTQLTAAGDTLLGTVPAGKVWVLRNIWFWTNSGSMRYVLAIGTTGTTGNRILNRTTPEFDNLDVRQALAAGETLHGLGSTTGGGYITITGYELDAV